MTCEQNARMVLAYLQSEETVLKRAKEVLESQLMRLQIDEMNLRVAYQNRKTKKKAETKNGMKVKKEPEVKTEVKLPKQMTNSNTETLELKPHHLGLFSKTKRNDEELPELLLEPYHLDPFSQTKRNDEELPELLLEPSYLVPFSSSKTEADEMLEPLYPNSLENSMGNSEDSST
ncbi:hypothetical protein AVEN_12022-1 [Araneus ventricosus]|uniref:Uncharacterized protein n=1 Tax=Araneus ventricosus TaxID=182803 RepID=A0A4Y2G6U5_ARAVE|nr:hypothetical protein AVEN_12022-1 [Araneus ventricosus]